MERLTNTQGFSWRAIQLLVKHAPRHRTNIETGGNPAVTAFEALRAIEEAIAGLSHATVTATVRAGPCQHRWAYAPTVGSIVCSDCHESHPHDHPETKAYLESVRTAADKTLALGDQA